MASIPQVCFVEILKNISTKGLKCQPPDDQYVQTVKTILLFHVLGKEQADDLSLFYQKFLDKKFPVHFKYQRFVNFYSLCIATEVR